MFSIGERYATAATIRARVAKVLASMVETGSIVDFMPNFTTGGFYITFVKGGIHDFIRLRINKRKPSIMTNSRDLHVSLRDSEDAVGSSIKRLLN